jgi:lysophospholipase L1-like esterase
MSRRTSNSNHRARENAKLFESPHFGKFEARRPARTGEVAESPVSGCSPHIIPTSFDGIHPNEKGYAIVGPSAQAVIDKTLWK